MLLQPTLGYTRHDTVITWDCNSGHSDNYEEIMTFSCKSLKFPTKWYRKLCNSVDLFLRNCKIKVNIFNIFEKNGSGREEETQILRNIGFKQTLHRDAFFYKNSVFSFQEALIRNHIFSGTFLWLYPSFSTQELKIKMKEQKLWNFKILKEQKNKQRQSYVQNKFRPYNILRYSQPFLAFSSFLTFLH